MKTIRVAAAVIRDGDRFFATAKGYGEFKGWWEFPGGKLEPGETPRQALEREIREELGVDIETGMHICTVEYDYPAFHLSMDCFLCTVTRGEIELKEALAGRWLHRDELDELRWLPADEAVIRKLKKMSISNQEEQSIV